MTGRLALQAKVFARFHEPHPEELLPEPVGRHAGRERMIGRHEPVGQIEPRWSHPFRHRELRQEGRRAAGDLLARLVIGATQHHEAVPHLRLVVEHVGPHHGLGEVIPCLVGRLEVANGRHQLVWPGFPHLRQPVAADSGDVG